MSWELERARLVLDAVRASVVYADFFNFAVADDELHRDLVYVESNPVETGAAVHVAIASGLLARTNGYLTFPDRTDLAKQRRQDQTRTALLWSRARRNCPAFAAIPFVRMVGVTGSLAANNPVGDADIDIMLVSTPGRLWLVRAAAIAIVRLARYQKIALCPNYLLSTRALTLTERDLYGAHEILQLVPMSGAHAYQELIASNPWIASFMPNRSRATVRVPSDTRVVRAARSAGELLLNGQFGDRFNNWEERRKVARFRVVDTSATFSEDVCEGHFRRHRPLVLAAFENRCASRGIDLEALQSSAIARGLEAARRYLELVR